MASGSFNEYTFASVRSLRSALRSFRTLEQMDDATSITIVLDLRRAMGDEVGNPTAVLTDYQRQLIQRNLIDDESVESLSEELGVSERNIEKTVLRGLQKLLRYLHGSVPEAFTNDMFEVMRDKSLSMKQVAQKIGKSIRSVEVACSRYRERERIPYRNRRRQTAGRESEP